VNCFMDSSKACASEVSVSAASRCAVLRFDPLTSHLLTACRAADEASGGASAAAESVAGATLAARAAAARLQGEEAEATTALLYQVRKEAFPDPPCSGHCLSPHAAQQLHMPQQYSAVPELPLYDALVHNPHINS
jgi:hypothetical protein